jgi:Xaa-Pro aminopeptidase
LSGAAVGVPPESLARLHRLLDAAGADGLVVVAESSRDADLAPFVGGAHLSESFVVAAAGRRPVLGYLTDMEREEAAGTGLEVLEPATLGVSRLRAAGRSPGEIWRHAIDAAWAELGLGRGAWLVAGHPAAGIPMALCSQPPAGGGDWRSGNEVTRRWRKFKPPQWRARMAAPAAGVCAALRAVARVLAAAQTRVGELWWEGGALTVGRLRRVVNLELAALDLWQPYGNILASGAAAAAPHTQGSSDHVLLAGEPLVVDLYPRGELYADCTRTFCVGEPPAAFVAAHAAVREALEESHRRCRPGARGWDLQAQACDLFEGRGYPTLRQSPDTRVGYVHGLGHGVGFELHEDPSFRQHAGEEGLLEVGDLLTLEPGLYDAAAGYGVRLEDLCYLSAEGIENLTPLPTSWDPGDWDRARD